MWKLCIPVIPSKRGGATLVSFFVASLVCVCVVFLFLSLCYFFVGGRLTISERETCPHPQGQWPR